MWIATCSGRRPAARAAFAWSTVWNCVPVQISQRSGASRTRQLRGSIGRMREIGHVVVGAELAWRAAASAASASPVRVTRAPGVCARRAYSTASASVSTAEAGPASHSISSASRPFLAAQNESATTATPEGTRTTCLTPRTARARSAPIVFGVPPNTGGRATSATSMPGTVASIPNVAVPGDLGAAVEAPRGLADDLELRGSLSATSGRHRDRAGLVDELPVGEGPAAGAQHAPVLGAHGGPIHLPRVGRRGQEHLARGGARPAQAIPLAGDAHAAAGELHPELRMGVGGGHRRGHHLHLGEIHLELLGDEHGQGGGDALSHLRLVHEDGDDVLPADADEGVRREVGAGRRAGGGPLSEDGQAERQEDAAGHRGGLEESAARGARRHRQAPWPMRPAACLMAARIRW